MAIIELSLILTTIFDLSFSEKCWGVSQTNDFERKWIIKRIPKAAKSWIKPRRKDESAWFAPNNQHHDPTDQQQPY